MDLVLDQVRDWMVVATVAVHLSPWVVVGQLQETSTLCVITIFIAKTNTVNSFLDF